MEFSYTELAAHFSARGLLRTYFMPARPDMIAQDFGPRLDLGWRVASADRGPLLWRSDPMTR